MERSALLQVDSLPPWGFVGVGGYETRDWGSVFLIRNMGLIVVLMGLGPSRVPSSVRRPGVSGTLAQPPLNVTGGGGSSSLAVTSESALKRQRRRGGCVGDSEHAASSSRLDFLEKEGSAGPQVD